MGRPKRRVGAPNAAAIDLPGSEGSYRWGRDLALVNGRILTLESAHPEVEAALVRSGRIALVGSNEDVRSAAAGAPVLDAGGRVVVPGLIDAHTDIEVACVAKRFQVSVHTPPLESLRQITDVLRRKASETPAGEWIIARGSFGLAERVPERRLLTRQDLDAVTQQHPLVVFSGRHVAMMNTRALREVRLWEPGATPPRGAVVHRDAAGRPTGIATELYYLLPSYSTEQVKTALRRNAREMFVEKGTTSLSTVPYSSDDIRADMDLQAEGDLPLRIRIYYHVTQMISLDGLLATGFVSGVDGDMFRFGGMKLFVDGAGHDGMGRRLEDFKWTQDDSFMEASRPASFRTTSMVE